MNIETRNKNNADSQTDAELLTRFCENQDQASFAIVIQRYSKLVLGVTYRILQDSHDAEDAAQLTFVKLAQKVHTFKESASIAGWLHHVARHTALDQLKASKRRQNHLKTETASLDDMIQTEEDEKALIGALQPTIDSAIHELPAKYRDVLIHFYLNEKSLNETAEILDCKISTLSMRLTRAKEKLRPILKRYGITTSLITASMLSDVSAGVRIPDQFTAHTMNLIQTMQAIPLPDSAYPESGQPWFASWSKSKSLHLTAAALVIVAACLYFLLKPTDVFSNKNVRPVAGVVATESSVTPLSAAEPAAPNLFQLVANEYTWSSVEFHSIRQALLEDTEYTQQVRNRSGESLLHVATKYYNEDLVLLLLLIGLDPNATDVDGRPPLFYAVSTDDKDTHLMRDLLILGGADVNHQTDECCNALITATLSGSTQQVATLLRMGANPITGYTQADRNPKYIAKTRDFEDIVEVLQEHEDKLNSRYQPKANPHPSTQALQFAFLQAVKQGDITTLRDTIRWGADINLRDSQGRTPLMNTLIHDQPHCAFWLLLNGADVDATDDKGNTPFLFSLYDNDWRSIYFSKLLLLKNTQVNHTNAERHNAVSLASLLGNAHGLQWALWTGGSATTTTTVHGTPMHIASQASRERIINTLRRNGVEELAFSSEDILWQLHDAAKQGNLQRLKELVPDQVAVDTPDPQGNSALINAIDYLRFDIARSLIDLGADVNFRNTFTGRTPLIASLSWKHQAMDNIRETLLHHGADPDIADASGNLPIILASKSGHFYPSIAQLIHFNCDINLQDSHGKTAYDYAAASEFKEALQFLNEVTAEVPTEIAQP